MERADRASGPERRVLLVLVTVLIGTSVGLIAGIIAFWAGATILVTLTTGGSAFLGAVAVTIALLGLLGVKNHD